MQAVFVTVILQLAWDAVPAVLVQTAFDEAVTAALIPKVAVPELPAAHVKLKFCSGAVGCKLALGGLRFGFVALGVAGTPLTVSCNVIICEPMILAVGQGVVDTAQANTVTGSAHKVAALSCRIS